VGLGAVAVAGLFLWMNVFKGLEARSGDWRQRLFARPESADKRIALVLIDQASLDVYSAQGYSWPWMREMYRPLIEYVSECGAAAIFIDLHFTEPSVFGVEDDRRFADAVAAAGRVFLPVHFSREENPPAPGRSAWLERFAEGEEIEPLSSIREMRSAVLPLPELMEAVRGVGDVQVPPDDDGIYRRIPLHTRLLGRVYPILPLALARCLDEGAGRGVPRDTRGNMLIRYHGPAGTYPSFSAAAVINSHIQRRAGETPQLPPETFRGKLVMVGGSAPGIMDLKSTPLSRICPGTEIMAAAVDNLLNRDYLRPAPAYLVGLWLAAVGLLGGVVFTLARKVWQIALLVIGIFALPAAASAAAYAAGMVLPFTAPVAAALLAFSAAVVLNYNLEGRRRRFVKRVFHHYLSPHVIERVLENPELLKLGGERREVTSFFSDVAGFTSISEGLSPEDLVLLLNEYLSAMTDILLESGGTLDKYEGDAIIAFWNAPLDQPDHAVRAVRAALRCQERLAGMRSDFEKRFGHGLRMRIGVNSGPAVVGNMGSHSRFDYTAMGDTINLAARLEGAGKIYSVPILIGENSFAAVEDQILCRRVDLIRVVGKKKPVHVYQPLGDKDALGQEEKSALEIFHSALGYYRARQWEQALGLFRSLEPDPLAHVYAGRAVRLRADPPGEDWDGVFELTSK